MREGVGGKRCHSNTLEKKPINHQDDQNNTPDAAGKQGKACKAKMKGYLPQWKRRKRRKRKEQRRRKTILKSYIAT